MKRFTLTMATLVALACTVNARGADDDVVKVFVLVGQSNMQGQASVKTLDHQIEDDRTKALFAHLHDGQGNYRERDDVSVHFLQHHGKLTVGFGAAADKFGPELGFGWTVGEALDEPVLIVKAAYGGRSLYRDFRPPSAGLPDAEHLADELERRQKKEPTATLDDIKEDYGAAYRDLMQEVDHARQHYGELFPQLAGKRLEMAGLVWFQGWNDMVNNEYSEAYTDNMICFIKDIRHDLGAPNLPVVIGQLGVDGPYKGDDASQDKKERFKANQAAAADVAEFAGNVAVVKTDQYWDPAAAEAYKHWKEDVEAWKHFGNDRPYHYLGSPKIIYAIGEAFGQQMLELTAAKKD